MKLLIQRTIHTGQEGLSPCRKWSPTSWRSCSFWCGRQSSRASPCMWEQLVVPGHRTTGSAPVKQAPSWGTDNGSDKKKGAET